MKIILTKEESLEYFYNSLCNGLSYVCGYGLMLDYNEQEYKLSRDKLVTPCYEDVLKQMLLDGYELRLVDTENEDEFKKITIKEVYERVQLTPHSHLMDAVNQNDDATTADVIIQTVFYNEVIFG